MSWWRRGRSLVLGVAALVVAAASGLLLLGLVRSEAGSGGLLVGAVLACVPVLPVVACFVWLDRWEPEPPRYLVQAFVWGATVAALIAALVNSLVAGSLTAMVGPAEAFTVTGVVVAPVVEEAAKGAFLLWFGWRHRHEFDGLIDGIVFGGIAAAGFAFTENILYFGRAYAFGLEEAGVPAGAGAAVATFVMRGLMSPFAHPLFTVALGLGVGLAAASRSLFVRLPAVFAGYLVAVTLHALWNGSALVGDGSGFLGVYLFVMVPVFFAGLALAVWSRNREGGVLRRQLPTYAAAGWIAPWEVPLLASLSIRRRLVADATRLGGPRGRAATRAYHAAATELAFLRERMLRGTAGPNAAERERALLAELATARAGAFVPGPPAGISPPSA